MRGGKGKMRKRNDEGGSEGGIEKENEGRKIELHYY